MRHIYKVFVVGALILAATAAMASDDLTARLPESIGAMSRIALVSGDAAQAEVDRLHGKPLPAVTSVLARYAHPDAGQGVRPAEVWISRVASETEARRQTGLMVHRMYENPNSPFKQPSRFDHAGTAVYRFTGMGQVHMIWFKGDLVYWVSADVQDEAILIEVLCR